MGRKVLGIVGTGMLLGGDLGLAAKAWIEQAESVFYHVADPATAAWLEQLKPGAKPLTLDRNQTRHEGYQKMCEPVMAAFSDHDLVTVVFYGHPAVLTDPTFLLREAAQTRDIHVKILPAVSSVDALLADLPADLFKQGCSIYEATDFVRRPPPIDNQRHLVLLQIAMVENRGRFDAESLRKGLEQVLAQLLNHYPGDHTCQVYTAAYHAGEQATLLPVALVDLPGCNMPEFATLYVPPLADQKEV